MGDKTGIEWTDATWNPIRGCSRVSEGCRNCYAERVAARFSGQGEPYHGLVQVTSKASGLKYENARAAGSWTSPRWNGTIKLVPEHLGDPLRWQRPRRVFVNSMSDLFHEGVPFEYIASVFGVMAASPRHTFQVLTKRPERAREFFAWIEAQPVSLGGPTVNAARGSRWHAWQYLDDLRVHDPAQPWAWPLPNVWLGVSCENQATADERIPVLLGLQAAVRFVSAEPLIGPIRFDRLVDDELGANWNGLEAGIHWVIVGGESGPGARPCDVAWVRSIVDQCRSAGTACFVKQLGARPHETIEPSGAPDDGGDRVELRLADRKGGDITEWPEDLRVREFPQGGADA